MYPNSLENKHLHKLLTNANAESYVFIAQNLCHLFLKNTVPTASEILI